MKPTPYEFDIPGIVNQTGKVIVDFLNNHPAEKRTVIIVAIITVVIFIWNPKKALKALKKSL